MTSKLTASLREAPATVPMFAAVALIVICAAGQASLRSLMPDGRLISPTGYPNGNAALWLIAAWPVLLLARSERLPWGLRGLLAGAAVLLADVALLSQSRGSVYATAVMLVLVFALLPGRVRTFAVLAPAVLGVAATAAAVLRVGNHLRHELVVPAHLHAAKAVIFAAAAAVGLAVAIGAAVESRSVLSPAAAARVRRGLTAMALA